MAESGWWGWTAGTRGTQEDLWSPTAEWGWWDWWDGWWDGFYAERRQSQVDDAPHDDRPSPSRQSQVDCCMLLYCICNHCCCCMLLYCICIHCNLLHCVVVCAVCGTSLLAFAVDEA